MSFTVKVVLARVAGSAEIDRNGPVEVLTRTTMLGLFDPHPAMLLQIEGASGAYFEAHWEGEQLKIGRRVEDQGW
jgi:hypothetical protein